MLNKSYFLKIYFEIFVPSLIHSIQSSSVANFLHLSERFCFTYIMIKLKTEGHICWVIYLPLKHKGRPPRRKDTSGEYGFCWIYIKQHFLNFNLNVSDLEIYSVDILKAMSLASLPKLWEFCGCSGQFEHTCNICIYKYPKSATRTLTERYPSFSY